MPPAELSTAEYRALAEWRYMLRRFLRVSETLARDGGLETQQYLLLLSIKGMPSERAPTVGDIAERLQVRQHSAAELIDRTEARGFVRRERGERARRQVLVRLTRKGDTVLRRIAERDRLELRSIGPSLTSALAEALATLDETVLT
jgi:DNA-binding MarR family transcriptional regulator